MKFLAIDFETANYSPDSACAVGLAVVEDKKNLCSTNLFCNNFGDGAVYIGGGWNKSDKTN